MHITEVTTRAGAKLYRRRRSLKRTVRDNDVLTGISMPRLRADTVVSRNDVTVGDENIPAGLGSNPVCIPAVKIVDNTDTVDEYLLASIQMNRIESPVAYGNVPNAYRTSA